MLFAGKIKMIVEIPLRSLNLSPNIVLSMKKVIKTSNPAAVELASELLRSGSVIALPTDTIYGLACSANDPAAIQKLYDIKGRNESKPVSICVSDITDLRHWGHADHLPDRLLDQLLPGAVTIILKKTENLNNPYLNPGINKIGIRIPDFEFIRQICRHFQSPIALTSANKSSEKSTLNVLEFKNLWPQLGGVFDGGALGVNEEQRSGSTVVDLAEQGKCEIIRKGIAHNETLGFIQEHHIHVVNN